MAPAPVTKVAQPVDVADPAMDVPASPQKSRPASGDLSDASSAATGEDRKGSTSTEEGANEEAFDGEVAPTATAVEEGSVTVAGQDATDEAAPLGEVESKGSEDGGMAAESKTAGSSQYEEESLDFKVCCCRRFPGVLVCCVPSLGCVSLMLSFCPRS